MCRLAEDRKGPVLNEDCYSAAAGKCSGIGDQASISRGRPHQHWLAISSPLAHFDPEIALIRSAEPSNLMTRIMADFV
jgi:hypothetical protein